MVGRKCEVRRKTKGGRSNELWLLDNVTSMVEFEGWVVAAMLLALAMCIDSTLLLRWFNTIWESSGTSILVM